MKLTTVVCGLLCTGVVGWMLRAEGLRGDQAAPKPSSKATHQDPGVLNVGAVGRPRTDLKANREQRRIPIGLPSPTGLTSAAQQETSQSQARAEDGPQLAELVAVDLEANFETGGAPSSKALHEQEIVRSAFQDVILPQGVSLQGLECKGESCQGKIRAPNTVAYNEAVQRVFVGSKAFRASTMSVYFPERKELSDGSLLATFYLFPPDYVPPS